MTIQKLSSVLAARGLIAEGQSIRCDPGGSGASSPWYVQVMLGVCAWFAGLFLLGFILMSFGRVLFNERDAWVPLLLLGVCACSAAAFIYAAVGEDNAFGSQFALALSIAGQLGIAVGLGGKWTVRAAIWGMLLIEIVLTIVMRNRLHRILSSLGAVIAWALATHDLLFGDMPGVSFSWGSRITGAHELSLVSVLLWVAVWAPVAFGAFWLVRNEAGWMAAGREKILRPVTSGVIASLSIAPVATHPAAFWMALGLGSPSDLTDGSLRATALWPLLAMLLTLLSMALAFAIRNRALVGLAILFCLLEVSSFYYVLGTTLLVKSIIMATLGVALMVSAHWLAKENA